MRDLGSAIRRPSQNIWEVALIGTSSKLLACVLALVLSASSYQWSHACTRILYVGDDGLVIAGRTMDWNDDTRTNLWVFPRGMQRDGAAGPNSAKSIRQPRHGGL